MSTSGACSSIVGGKEMVLMTMRVIDIAAFLTAGAESKRDSSWAD
jgi:hypothetical protein